MSRIPSNIGFQTPPAGSTGQVSSALQDVDLDQFLNLMIAELQNQDPLDPLDNSEMLQQLTQIREIGSNDRLTATLDAVLSGQNLATASGLIGKEIRALTDNAENIEGLVDRVTIQVDNETDKRSLKVHVGQHSVSLENIREVIGQ